ncbi:DNA-binding transcription factor yap1, partial [Nowakowskiella sp. JEL0078]
HVDKKTSWDQPMINVFKEEYESDIQETLPKEWEESLTPDGVSYFVNHETKETTWIDPRTGKTSPAWKDHNRKTRIQAPIFFPLCESRASSETIIMDNELAELTEIRQNNDIYSSMFKHCEGLTNYFSNDDSTKIKKENDDTMKRKYNPPSYYEVAFDLA